MFKTKATKEGTFKAFKISLSKLVLTAQASTAERELCLLWSQMHHKKQHGFGLSSQAPNTGALCLVQGAHCHSPYAWN